VSKPGENSPDLRVRVNLARLHEFPSKVDADVAEVRARLHQVMDPLPPLDLSPFVDAVFRTAASGEWTTTDVLVNEQTANRRALKLMNQFHGHT
jgi:hypothetical protein